MSQKSHLCRLLMVSLFFIFILLALLWRMVDLTILKRQFLLEQGDARSLRVIDIPAYRGMITDREGVPLAISTPVKSLWVNPKQFTPNEQQTKALARALNTPAKALMLKLQDHANREFVYLQRHLSPALAQKIEALGIPGLHFQDEFKRFYPQTESVAQLIGFTDVDDRGIEGLELAYDDWLVGVTGKQRVVKDRLGRIIESLNVVREPRAGRELQLSIDRRIQDFAYQELTAVIDKFEARSGSVVVLDAKTGDVLAVANAPSFNPNSRGRYTQETYRNKAITDVFEPGSVMKPFSIASGLESGLFKPETLIDTKPGWMTIQGNVIKDSSQHGVLDITGILQRSSNVGVSKVVLASSPEHFLSLLQRVGVGQRTESTYPGESEGMLASRAAAKPFVLATLSFGYGLSVTALQLAKSYLIFANQGQLIPISLLRRDEVPDGVSVIQPKTAQQVLRMLEMVVSGGGTGRSAQIPGYRVAGKTGTSRIAGKQGYKESRHIASFVGLAPVSSPKFIVAVVIHEPRRISYYGAVVAAPLFKKVMRMALHLFDIQPDEVAESV